jgi:hypothetical protein
MAFCAGLTKSGESEVAEDRSADETPEDPPWEVNEYRYEPPWWVEFFAGPSWGTGVPLVFVLIFLLWKWFAS